MSYTFTPMNKEDAQAIFSWHYDGQYATYDLQGELDDNSELLDQRSPYYAVRDERGELVGFFCYGSAAAIQGYNEPYLFSEDGSLLVGLGMRPDLTGKGTGVGFVQAGLAFARRKFAPHRFRLFVLSWNERAIKVYEKVGFRRVRRVLQKNIHGEKEFIE